MMVRKILFLPLIAAFVSSCGHTFSVEAEIGSDDYDGVKVYMIRKHPVEYSENTVLDSTVISGGRYGFTYDASGEPFVAIFELEPKGAEGHTVFYYDLPQASCVVEPGKAELGYTAAGVSVSGTPSNDDFEKYILAPQRQARAKSMAYSARTSRSDSIQYFYNETRQPQATFVKQNAGSLVGATVFFSKSRDFYGDSLYMSLEKEIAPEFIEMEKARTERMEAERKAMDAAREASRKGNHFIDFVSESADGSPVRFSEIAGRGKVTLLVFWASWCRPCRLEIPELKRLYGTYHKDGLDIVSVSLDNRKEEWEKAVSEENMPWSQWSTLEGFDSASAKAYAVHSIPYVVLIDRKGLISMVNMHGKVLEDSIRNLLDFQD